MALSLSPTLYEPATFMHTMNNLFSDLLESGMAVHLDNNLVYFCIVKEFFTLLEKVLACLYWYTF